MGYGFFRVLAFVATLGIVYVSVEAATNHVIAAVVTVVLSPVAWLVTDLPSGGQPPDGDSGSGDGAPQGR